MTPGLAEFRAALSVVKATPDARAARIAVLRAQIAAGAYKPDPSAIARRILEQGL